jgi:Cu(I)/Ag(I) efflux system membrane protein CusA/SilA
MAYIVRGLGYIKNIKDVEEIAIKIIIGSRERYRFCSNGWDLRLGILMQMEKAKWSAELCDALR